MTMAFLLLLFSSRIRDGPNVRSFNFLTSALPSSIHDFWVVARLTCSRRCLDDDSRTPAYGSTLETCGEIIPHPRQLPPHSPRERPPHKANHLQSRTPTGPSSRGLDINTYRRCHVWAPRYPDAYLGDTSEILNSVRLYQASGGTQLSKAETFIRECRARGRTSLILKPARPRLSLHARRRPGHRTSRMNGTGIAAD